MSSSGNRNGTTAVIGGGLAGLAAAQRLRERGARAELYERNGSLGGHAGSHVTDGFSFDQGPHVSFTRKKEVQDLFAAAVGQEYHTLSAGVYNYWQGHLVWHPPLCNLHGLPVDVVHACVTDFVKAQYEDDRRIRNYADWCLKTHGEAFSREFTFRYTRKYWTTDAENLDTDWVAPRIYAPKVAEVVRGALAAQQKNFHYIDHIRYPKRGGFASYLQAFAPSEHNHCNREVTAIDLRRGGIEFADGTDAGFDHLVCAMPLDRFIGLLRDVPPEVAEAAGDLMCTSLTVVNLGIDRPDGFPETDWMYVYDEDIPFARLNFPHRFAPANAPEGCGSIQVEIYHSRWKPRWVSDPVGATVEGLRKMNLLHPSDTILVSEIEEIDHANVMFDLNRIRNLGTVREYLDEQGVPCCGRYGCWEYYWTDDSVLSGFGAAEAILEAQAGARRADRTAVRAIDCEE